MKVSVIPYLIPKFLNNSIFKNKNFRFKSRCYLILDILCENYYKKKTKIRNYVNIYSLLLKDRIGKNYRQYLDFLIKNNIIEENDSYCFDDGSFKKHFCFTKSFRLQPLYCKQFKLVKQKSFKKNVKIKNLARIDCPTTEFLDKNIKKLQLMQNDINTNDKNEYYGFQRLAQQLSDQISNVRRGKTVKRIYHIISECPQIIRRYLKVNTKSLQEWDIKSAHPVLLLDLYENKDCNEARLYKEFLNKDIYSILPAYDRETTKTLFRRFMYSKNHMGAGAAQINTYFYFHFPVLWSKIMKFKGKTLARHLQDLESYIINDLILNKCKENDLFFISIHDGYLGIEEECYKINQWIQEEFQKRFDFIPILNKKS